MLSDRAAAEMQLSRSRRDTAPSLAMGAIAKAAPGAMGVRSP